MAGFDMFQPGHSCIVCSAADVLSAALQTCNASARPRMAAERGATSSRGLARERAHVPEKACPGLDQKNLERTPIDPTGMRCRPSSPTPRVRAWQWRSGLVAMSVEAGLAAISTGPRVLAS
jgi:hypothetical protein